jgi:glutathione synthase/RimK-type ligase-like ATP-grasp enzyme
MTSEGAVAPRRTPAPARLLVDSVRRYAQSHAWTFEAHSHDWILRLTRGHAVHVVHGYDLGLNRSAAACVANDKSATADVLAAAGLAHVPHRVFLHPRFLDFVPVDGNWADMLGAFEAFGRDVVIKDNEGTGGMEVFRARTVKQLEQQAHTLFAIARAVAISPYLSISREQRFIMLDDACVFAYAKERPSVTGDGKQPLGALIAASGVARDGPQLLDLEVSLASVPAAGEVIPLDWRHNLGRGARPLRIDPAAPEAAGTLALARRAMAALGLRFASVDIVTVAGTDHVLEINAGVMLEVAARMGSDGRALADAIYHQALDRALAAGAT